MPSGSMLPQDNVESGAGGPKERTQIFAARARVDRVDIVVLGGDQELPRRRSRRPPIERLGIEVACNPRMKARVEADVAGAVPGQRGYREIAAPVGTAVVGQHRLPIAVPQTASPSRRAPSQLRRGAIGSRSTPLHLPEDRGKIDFSFKNGSLDSRNRWYIRDLDTILACRPAAEFSAVGSGLAGEFGGQFIIALYA
jgi:hypothetical protein